MDFPTSLVHAVEAAPHRRVVTGHMAAIVGKLFPRGEPRRLADDLVAFHYKLAAISVRDDPLAAEQRHRAVRAVVEGDKVNKGMGLVRRQTAAAVVVAELVEMSRQTGKFNGTGHQTHKGEKWPVRKRER